MLGIANSHQDEFVERRMNFELTAAEIQALHVLAIRERNRTHDNDIGVVNLARKLLEFRRRFTI